MTRYCKFPGCQTGQTCPWLHRSRRTNREARTWDWDSQWRTVRRSRRSLPRNNNPRPHKRHCRSKAARGRRTLRIARRHRIRARPNRRTVRDSKLAPPPRTPRKPPSGRRLVRPFRRRRSCGRPCKTAAAVRRPIESRSGRTTSSRSKPVRSRRTLRTTPRRTRPEARRTFRQQCTGPSRNSRHSRTDSRHSTDYWAFRNVWSHRLPTRRPPAPRRRRPRPARPRHGPALPSDPRTPARRRGPPIATRVQYTPRRSAPDCKRARSAWYEAIRDVARKPRAVPPARAACTESQQVLGRPNVRRFKPASTSHVAAQGLSCRRAPR